MGKMHRLTLEVGKRRRLKLELMKRKRPKLASRGNDEETEVGNGEGDKPVAIGVCHECTHCKLVVKGSHQIWSEMLATGITPSERVTITPLVHSIR